MLVKELIKELQNCPQDAVVVTCTNRRHDVYGEIQSVDDEAFFADGEVFGINDEDEEDGVRKESDGFKRFIMDQRTQIHIKKDDQFYVIHNKWGYGHNMINDVQKIIDAGLFDGADIKDLLLPFRCENSPYYTLDKGDNNNGVFLLDCDSKSYCFLAGNEDIEYLTYKASFDNKRALNTVKYLKIWSEEHLKNAESIENLFEQNGYNLMTNYSCESGNLVSTFIEQSKAFTKISTDNKNSYLVLR